MTQKLIIVGAGGNSKVILDSIFTRKQILSEDLEILGFLDDDNTKKEIKGYPVLGPISLIIDYIGQSNLAFVDGIGANSIRKLLYEKYSNVSWYTLVHPSAILGSGVVLGEGTIVMPGVIINVDTKVGKKALINTGAILEHDNKISDFTHIASGVTTAGNVHIGELTMLGTGTKVIQGIHIGENTMVGAGATVISDIPSHCTAVGVPARVIKKND
ncbi:MAG: acetyltransferase [Anaerovorax sp.]|nr:acetyltransferase [Anaerovorax sp.]